MHAASMKSLAVVAATFFTLVSAMACAQDSSRDSLAVQAARSKSIAASAHRKFYEPGDVDTSDLPRYVPQQRVSGEIRVWGSDLFGGPEMKQRLEEGFRKFHPDARLTYNLKGPAMAFAGLLTQSSDIGPSRRITWEQLLAFERVFNHEPLVVNGMTGWGVNSPFVIAVNKDNPIAGLSMKQLDGIFGAERNGGWVGTAWHPEFARGPEDNIRTWGQLGLKGEWADKPITVHGYGLKYLFGPRFSEDVLRGSDKWNEKLQQYVNYATPQGTLKSADQQMAEAVGKDRYAIAYYAAGRGKDPNVKILPIAAGDGRDFVAPTLAAVRDHSYPLHDSMYVYINRAPHAALDPKVREFMRFLLSREGQEIVASDTTMLPLTAALAREELKKLD